MSKRRLALYGKPGYADVETEATKGATVGRDLYAADGSLYVPAVAASSAALPATVWQRILEVPANLQAIAALALGAGTFIARASTGVLAAKPISDTGLALAAAADAAAARTVIGAAPDTLPAHTVGALPAATPRRIIFVTDLAGAPAPCYSDGTDWRRFSDNTIAS